MKQIQQDIIQAIRNNRNFVSGSASSTGYARKYSLSGVRDRLRWGVDRDFRYELWNNNIAFGNAADRKIYVSTCGFNTPTTVSRLNAIFAGFDIPMSAMVRGKQICYSLNGNDIHPNFASKILAGDWVVKFV